MVIHELWSQGVLLREDITTRWRPGADGHVELLPKSAQLSFRWFGDREIRTRAGAVPSQGIRLDPGRDRKAFESVRCGIAPRDPGMPTSPIWQWILFHPVPQLTLDDLVRSSTIRLVESTDRGVRIVIESGEPAFLVGAEIDLDSIHGWLISRISLRSGWVAEVKEFQNIDELWIPKTVDRELKNFRSRVRVSQVSLATDMSNELQPLDFPEGARVDDTVSQTIHIWGRGAPELTFHTFDAFAEHVNERIEASATTASQPLQAVGADRTSWVVIVNLTTLAAVAGLLIARYWLARR